MRSHLNLLLFLVVATFWGGSFVSIKILLEAVPPFLGAALRLGLAFVFLAIAFDGLKKNTRVPVRLRSKIWLAGLFAQGFPMALLFWGERSVAPGLAGVINGTTAIWTFLLGVLFVKAKEPFSSRKLIGLLIAIAGVITIFWPLLFDRGEKTELWGAIAVMGMAVSYAIGTLLTKVLLSGEKSVNLYANLYHQQFSSFVFLFVLSAFFEDWPVWQQFVRHPTAWLALLYLSLCSTAISWLIYFHLVKEWGAVNAAAVSYLIPVMGLVWDFSIFGNLPDGFEIIGVIFILVGIFLINATILNGKPRVRVKGSKLRDEARKGMGA